VTLGQWRALDDRVADPEVAEGTRESQHDERERHQTEVCGRQQAGEQDADEELADRADRRTGEAPWRPGGSIGQSAAFAVIRSAVRSSQTAAEGGRSAAELMALSRRGA
jgi:hypothetical protein